MLPQLLIAQCKAQCLGSPKRKVIRFPEIGQPELDGEQEFMCCDSIRPYAH